MASDKEQAAIKKQLEFYFSDSNLPNDKFMLGLVSADPEGYVSLEKLCTFKRMKTLGATVENSGTALKGSPLLAVSEDGKRIKRITPLPEKSDVEARSIYAKPCPVDSTLESIEEYFSEHGKVLSVRLRRVPHNRVFKGSVFVEFDSEEKAKEVQAKSLKIKGKFRIQGKRGDDESCFEEVEKDLTLHMKADYQKLKAAEDAEKKKSKKAGNGGEKAEKGKEEAEEEAEEEAVEAVEVQTPGLVVKFEGVGEGVSREDIKESFVKQGEVAFIDFGRGKTEGYVRFEAAESATKAVGEMTDEDKTFGGKVATIALISGDEEKAYWGKIAALKKNKKKGGRGGGRGRGGRGGRGRGQKRSRDDSDGPKPKRTKM